MARKQTPPADTSASGKPDAHALLVRIYQDEDADMHMRLDAAKAAIRFEKPALASVEQKMEHTVRNVVRVPAPAVSVEGWKARILKPRAS